MKEDFMMFANQGNQEIERYALYMNLLIEQLENTIGKLMFLS